MTGFSESIDDLFVSQLETWDLAQTNYSQLRNVLVRKIDYGPFYVTVQFNPGRITSSSAKVDTRSIEARPCFLCAANRPAAQKGVPFEGDYIVLVNPFPIFRRHLTIVSEKHTDQRIKGNFAAMLRLAHLLPDYEIFYNGPQCGASAPDHLHFQAGNKGFLPIENDFVLSRVCSRHAEDTGYEIWLWTGYMRGILTLKGDDASKLADVFYRFYDLFEKQQPDKPEPMLNILVSYSGGFWTIHIIPRKKHRPSQFFDDGAGQILLSPASVDMGGVVITPREADFEKINADDIADIFSQTCFTDKELFSIISDIL